MPKKISGEPKPKLLSPHALAEEKLAGSGLSEVDAIELGMEVLSAEKTAKLGFEVLPALKINYFGPDKRPLSGYPKHPPFYRLRYLAQPNDFKKLTTEKAMRYTQPPNTACCAYFPKNMDWRLLSDAGQNLIFTEGEFKAAAACKAGYPTIGLGGVYNWRALSKGIELLPELKAINWVQRHVYICFDSDYLTNRMVCAALRDLGETLVDQGAYVYVATLPATGKNAKVGIDDLLVAEGVDALARVLHAAEPLGLTRTLFSFNENYIYVRDPGLIINQKTDAKVAPGPFKEHLEAAKSYQEQKLQPNGEVSYKPISAAAAWLSWPLRHDAKKITYAPGSPKFIEPEALYNIWPGWGVEPKRGEVKPFLDLLDHLFKGAEPEAKKWFIQWCAYPLQHPGTKLFQSAVFHGIKHGTGKTLIGVTLGRIYDKNYTLIGQQELHGGFNEWAEAKQFVMGDDVTGSNKRQDSDMLKKLITQNEMRINVKYIPSYVVPDCVNYFFTSNHPDAFFLEDDDRRYFIHEVQVTPLGEKVYQDYMRWLDGGGKRGSNEGGGAAALFDYLLRLDLKGFNPNAAAYKTAARERMIAGVQSDLGSWVRQLIATPDQILRTGEILIKKDLFTSRELLALYDPIAKTGTTANGLGRELTRAGIGQIYQGRPVKLADGSQGRFYAVRNAASWLALPISDCVDHINKFNGQMSAVTGRKEKY